MACLDMYNNNDNNNNRGNKTSSNICPPMSPRISFSNDFVDTQQQQQQQQQRLSLREAPVSTDFEFSVTNNYSIMSGADELFFKGRLLPFNHNNNQVMQRTLRDELLVNDDDDYEDADLSFRPPKVGGGGSSMRWKGLLGLKRSHIAGGSKKAHHAETSSVVHESYRNNKPGNFVTEDVHVTKTSRELLNEGGSSSTCRDVRDWDLDG